MSLQVPKESGFVWSIEKDQGTRLVLFNKLNDFKIFSFVIHSLSSRDRSRFLLIGKKIKLQERLTLKLTNFAGGKLWNMTGDFLWAM